MDDLKQRQEQLDRYAASRQRVYRDEKDAEYRRSAMDGAVNLFPRQ